MSTEAAPREAPGENGVKVKRTGDDAWSGGNTIQKRAKIYVDEVNGVLKDPIAGDEQQTLSQNSPAITLPVHPAWQMTRSHRKGGLRRRLVSPSESLWSEEGVDIVLSNPTGRCEKKYEENSVQTCTGTPAVNTTIGAASEGDDPTSKLMTVPEIPLTSTPSLIISPNGQQILPHLPSDSGQTSQPLPLPLATPLETYLPPYVNDLPSSSDSSKLTQIGPTQASVLRTSHSGLPQFAQVCKYTTSDSNSNEVRASLKLFDEKLATRLSQLTASVIAQARTKGDDVSTITFSYGDVSALLDHFGNLARSHIGSIHAALSTRIGTLETERDELIRCSTANEVVFNHQQDRIRNLEARLKRSQPQPPSSTVVTSTPTPSSRYPNTTVQMTTLPPINSTCQSSLAVGQAGLLVDQGPYNNRHSLNQGIYPQLTHLQAPPTAPHWSASTMMWNVELQQHVDGYHFPAPSNPPNQVAHFTVNDRLHLSKGQRTVSNTASEASRLRQGRDQWRNHAEEYARRVGIADSMIQQMQRQLNEAKTSGSDLQIRFDQMERWNLDLQRQIKYWVSVSAQMRQVQPQISISTADLVIPHNTNPTLEQMTPAATPPLTLSALATIQLPINANNTEPTKVVISSEHDRENLTKRLESMSALAEMYIEKTDVAEKALKQQVERAEIAERELKKVKGAINGLLKSRG